MFQVLGIGGYRVYLRLQGRAELAAARSGAGLAFPRAEHRAGMLVAVQADALLFEAAT